MNNIHFLGSPNNNSIEVIFSIIKNKFKKIKKDKLKIKPLIIISINKTIESKKKVMKKYLKVQKIMTIKT